MFPRIDPKVDFAFKWLFGREQNAGLLIDLIDSVLNPKPSERIREITILNPFSDQDALDDKLCILDVKARDEQGRQHNVEMQMLATPPLPKRVVYYATRFHQDQLSQGQDYSELKPTICICFVDGIVFKGLAEFHSCFRLVDAATGALLTDDLEIRIMELPKFTKSLAETRNALEYWLYFLRNATNLDVDDLPNPLSSYVPVCKAMEELKMLSQTEQERQRYEARRKFHLDEISLRNWANRQRQEGRLEGREEGRQEGIRQALLKILEKRFGVIPDDLKRRIHAADAVALERAFEQLVNLTSLEDLDI